MNAGRHGRRLLGLMILAALGGGCGRRPPPRDTSRSRPPIAPSVVCERPFAGGSRAAVARIAWGGPPAPRRLAVLWADGRFAAYSPEKSPIASASGPPAPARPATALAWIGADRLVSGDRDGLELWDVSTDRATSLHRRDCGGVTAIAVESGGDEDPSLVVGSGDGRVRRFPLRRDDRIEAASAESGAGSAVASLAVLSGKRQVLAIHEDGQARPWRGDRPGPASPAIPARAVAIARSRMARLVDGPAVVLDAEGGKSRVLRLPAVAGSVALLRGGTSLVVGGEGGLWLVPVPEKGAIRPVTIRALPLSGGPSPVAADPSDPSGRRLAVGLASGSVEVADVGALERRAGPMSLDDAPGLAFRPHERMGRARGESAESRLPAALRAKIAAAREKFDRGETGGLAGVLRDLEDDPALSRSATPELLALMAAVEQATIGPSAETARLLKAARSAFAREGVPDRQADVCFWEGWNLARPFVADAGPRDRRSLEEALGLICQAESLYEACRPPLPRQARLCQAAKAWILLDLGEVRAATLAFRPAFEAARLDPVLGQVAELDRIAAALSAAKGDRLGAAAAEARALGRLGPDDRPDQAREAALHRASLLAALGRWREAAAALEPDRPGDAEWSLMRAGFLRKSGARIAPPASCSEDDPRDAPLRAALGLGSPEARVNDLAIASEAHRRDGLDHLAVAADLERAELLEASGRTAEASPVFAAVARSLRSMPLDVLAHGSEAVPTLIARSHRGLARCQLVLHRPGSALAAIEAGAMARWSLASNGAAPKGAAMGLPEAEFAAAQKLRAARSASERRDGVAASGDRPEISRLEASLSAAHRGFHPGDPVAGFPVASLGLSDAEAVLVVAALGPESLAAFLIRGDHEPEAVLVPIARAALARGVRSWRQDLGQGGRPILPTEADEIPLPLPPEPDVKLAAMPRTQGLPWERLLHDALIGPFETRLIGVERLIVVAGDELEGFPFEVLGRDRRLGERFAMTYAPSATFVIAGRDGRRIAPVVSNRALVISAGAEPPGLVAAMKAGGFQPETFAGDAARPDRLLSGPMASYRVLHLAATATTHPSRSPFGAADLRLRPGGEPPRRDGRLSGADLASIPLRAQVVTLAIHDREGTNAAGLRDLARDAMASGAEAVLLTLWEPPAASRLRFFAEFYKHSGAGRPAQEAVEAARLAVALEPAFRDPVHWAGYVLYSVSRLENRPIPAGKK